jgi:hypothetical protein
MITKVVEAGSKESKERQDCRRSFEDIDGHLLEIIVYIDESQTKMNEDRPQLCRLTLQPPSCRKSRIICSNCSLVISPFAYLSLTIDAASGLCCCGYE